MLPASRQFQLVDSQRGVVALITSIVVGLLLVVITTSGIALMNSELRQATDYDQSVKAYYAAEAGVEDALAVIRRNLDQAAIDPIPDSPDCNPLDPAEADLGGGISYTCQIVTSQSNLIEGELGAEESVQIDLSGLKLASGARVRVEWNQQTSSPDSGSDPRTLSGIPAQFPPNNINPADTSYWPGRFPAVMETTFLEYPDRTFNAADISHNIVVAKPISGGGHPTVSWRDNRKPRLSGCRDKTDGDYNCAIVFRSFSGDHNYVLRLQARYSQAHYRISITNSSGDVLKAPKGQVLVDVTGRAGDVFRRVIVKIPIAAQPLPHAILLADDKICKVFKVSRITLTANNEAGCAL